MQSYLTARGSPKNLSDLYKKYVKVSDVSEAFKVLATKNDTKTKSIPEIEDK